MAGAVASSCGQLHLMTITMLGMMEQGERYHNWRCFFWVDAHLSSYRWPWEELILLLCFGRNAFTICWQSSVLFKWFWWSKLAGMVAMPFMIIGMHLGFNLFQLVHLWLAMECSPSSLWLIVVLCRVDAGVHVVTALVVLHMLFVWHIVCVALITLFQTWFKQNPSSHLFSITSYFSTSIASLIIRVCLCYVASSSVVPSKSIQCLVAVTCCERTEKLTPCVIVSMCSVVLSRVLPHPECDGYDSTKM